MKGDCIISSPSGILVLRGKRGKFLTGEGGSRIAGPFDFGVKRERGWLYLGDMPDSRVVFLWALNSFGGVDTSMITKNVGEANKVDLAMCV